MAPNIQVFVQVALLFCVVTTSMGGITNLQKAFSQLENKVNVQQEEIKLLHNLVEQLEKRLEPLEEKGEIHCRGSNTTYSPYTSCLFVRSILLLTIELMGLFLCMMSLYVGEWQEKYSIIENSKLYQWRNSLTQAFST